MWSSAGGVPAANSPLWQNPALKTRHAIHTSVGLQDVLVGTTTTLQSRLAANGIPHIVDNFDGGHEWHVWRLNLREFASKVAFRSTRVELTPGAGTITVTVTPVTTEPARPPEPSRSRAARPSRWSAARRRWPSRTRTAREGALQRRRALQREQRHDHLLGDERHRRRGRHRARDAVADARAGGDASARSSPASPNVYTATTTANVISSAGDAALTVSDPGHLANGAFTLPQPLQVSIAPNAWSGPVSNATSTITFRQPVGATDALRTGTYSRTLTFTLSTTNP